MKKTILLSATAFAVIGLITVIAISCNKNKSEIEKATQTQKTNLAIGTASTCNCGGKPNGCPTFNNCVKKFMGSASSRNFTINWTSCQACGNTLPPPSTGLVCFTGSCNELYVQINDLPPCLQNCYPVPFCQKVTQVVCQGSSYSIQFISDDGTQTFSITGDPHISVECNPTNGNPYSRCEGDLTWN